MGLSIGIIGAHRNRTDKEELDFQLQKAQELGDKINPAISLVNEYNLYGDTVPSLCIYYSNKIVEAYKFIMSKDVSYAHSILREAVEAYLVDEMVKPALIAMVDFLDRNSSFMSKIRYAFTGKIDTTRLDDYVRYTNSIYEFDFQKDAVKIINHYIDTFLKQPYYCGGINNDIDLINAELKDLGIEEKVEHREDPYKIPTIPHLSQEQYKQLLSEFLGNINEFCKVYEEKFGDTPEDVKQFQSFFSDALDNMESSDDKKID